MQKVLGWTAEVVRHPPKVAPEEVMRAWVRKWNEEGVPIDLGRGAHLRLVGTEQEDEQRLREAAAERRSFHLRGHESPDGEEIGSLVRLFRQFPETV